MKPGPVATVYDAMGDRPKAEPSPAEAIYAFGAWLTTRPGSLVVGGTHAASPMAELVERFRLAQGWTAPREDYFTRIEYVDERAEGAEPPVSPDLRLQPKFDECHTAEPSLHELILRYYGHHFSPEETARYVLRYEAAFAATPPVPVVPAMTDDDILDIATTMFPRWREDIQERFVLLLSHAVISAYRARPAEQDTAPTQTPVGESGQTSAGAVRRPVSEEVVMLAIRHAIYAIPTEEMGSRDLVTYYAEKAALIALRGKS